jgi:alanyl-tRNA synthetase
MQLSVDPVQRHAKMRAHTATHLLHAQLAAIFPQTKQAGSLVDEDYLRFDFYADTLLTDEQIATIESNIGNLIVQAHPVSTQEMSYDQAIAVWAKAFFEDKYGDMVRVVRIGHPDESQDLKDAESSSAWQTISIELCGWTHVSNTKDIGWFSIVSQEAVASGVKRIIAHTGPMLTRDIQEQRKLIHTIAQKFSVPVKQLLPKIDKILKEYKLLEDDLEKTKNSAVRTYINWLKPSEAKDGFTVYNIDWSYDFKKVIEICKNKSEDLVIYNQDWSFAIIGWSAKSFAQSHNLKWGWSDTFFQWKDPKILELTA